VGGPVGIRAGDWTQFHGDPPPQRTKIPIWLPALRSPMIELAAEIGDGLLGHPTWSRSWITEVVPRHIQAGLERAGRRREDLHVCVQLFVTPNHDSAESVEDARAVTAAKRRAVTVIALVSKVPTLNPDQRPGPLAEVAAVPGRDYWRGGASDGSGRPNAPGPAWKSPINRTPTAAAPMDHSGCRPTWAK
jgi:alkanesulfonate monooxygenase SsuD/methylene tetrahydromethanopterin reductase-like flavin-dependent oxidoreductase (luciferase family)